MLTQLSIRNFTTVEHLDLDLAPNATALTGETGAGKSVLLGAIGMIAGDRTDTDRIRHGQSKADISATFAIKNLNNVNQWLIEHELQDTDQHETGELIIRRVINKDGRSKAFINGVSCPLNLLKQLAPMLVHIHSQHEHQRLNASNYQLGMLDHFADLSDDADRVKQLYRDWRSASQQLNELQANIKDDATGQLLQYQLQELDALQLQERELSQLEAELKVLSSADEAIIDAQALIQILAGDSYDEPQLDNALLRAEQLAQQLNDKGADTANLISCINEALIAVQEAANEVKLVAQGLESNPQRLSEVEQRLNSIYDIARKHRVNPDQLADHHARLHAQHAAITDSEQTITHLESKLDSLQQDWHQAAVKLHANRIKQAAHLNKCVIEILDKVGMQGTQFHCKLESNESAQPREQGITDISFTIAPSPSAPLKPISKVASGGELSRISLALQTVTQAAGNVPTMIFDEVDSGIGGETGHAVGTMLADLGSHSQLLSVTHLAQVAAKAHQQLVISKSLHNEVATTSIRHVEGEDRIREIARMMGASNAEEGCEIAKQLLTTQPLMNV